MKLFGWMLLVGSILAVGSMPAWADDDADCRNQKLPIDQAMEACKRVIARNELRTKRAELQTQSIGAFTNCTMFGWGVDNPSSNLYKQCDGLLGSQAIDPDIRATFYKSRGNAYASKGDARRARMDYTTAKQLDPNVQ